jgi:hypothetical protein
MAGPRLLVCFVVIAVALACASSAVGAGLGAPIAASTGQCLTSSGDGGVGEILDPFVPSDDDPTPTVTGDPNALPPAGLDISITATGQGTLGGMFDESSIPFWAGDTMWFSAGQATGATLSCDQNLTYTIDVYNIPMAPVTFMGRTSEDDPDGSSDEFGFVTFDTAGPYTEQASVSSGELVIDPNSNPYGQFPWGSQFQMPTPSSPTTLICSGSCLDGNSGYEEMSFAGISATPTSYTISVNPGIPPVTLTYVAGRVEDGDRRIQLVLDASAAGRLTGNIIEGPRWYDAVSRALKAGTNTLTISLDVDAAQRAIVARHPVRTSLTLTTSWGTSPMLRRTVPR